MRTDGTGAIQFQPDTEFRRFCAVSEAVAEAAGRGLREMLQSLEDGVGRPVAVAGESWQILACSKAAPWREGETAFRAQDGEKVRGAMERARHCRFKIGSFTKLCIWRAAKGGRVLGYLVLEENLRPLDEWEQQVIDRALPLIALELMDREEMDTRSGDEFLERLIAGEEDTPYLCTLHGFDDTKKHICIVARSLGSGEEGSRGHAARGLARSMALAAGDRGVFLGTRDDLAAMFVYFPADVPDPEVLAEGRGILAGALERMRRHGQKAQLGMSSPNGSMAEVRQCFLQAAASVELGRRIFQADSYVYEDQYLYHILYESMSREKLRALYERTVKPLVDYDRQAGTEFVKTLLLFLKMGQNASRTAQKLYIHRNTFLYRIKKIKEILGSDLSGSDSALMIQLGFRAAVLLGEYKGQRELLE
ncbi:PucR family transcriptional regulator [Gehongia tenuis]|uniref:Helix-turn-helix domain-containing protein n=1 Tax=Gehongia tenuis TaxID=2763655 RepID=A0A926HNN3_9FIRM|nr:helix-turn-helix domain-containing protein [Gehongia tenuis]MBC8530794.1 helix-turn-helix domain-containing protein [Gehongia tenuis]